MAHDLPCFCCVPKQLLSQHVSKERLRPGRFGIGSSAVAGASESVIAASGGVAGLSGQTDFFTLIDRWSIASRNTPGGMGARVDPMLASLSASSLLARPT